MKYNILVIEREYASGGQEIGSKVASDLGIPCYGREILELAAKRKGTSPEYLESLEERATTSFLYSIYMLANEFSAHGRTMPDTDALYLAESEVIHEISQRGPAVFVGRCASHVLEGRRDVLNVFIHAGKDFRKQRAVQTYGVSPQTAEAVLRQFDKRRANYYQSNTGHPWNNMNSYPITLNSGTLGIEKCAAILTAAMKS